MIFDENKLCTACECVDVHENAVGFKLPVHALCAVLVSSGMASVAGGDDAAVLAAGGIAVLTGGGEVLLEKDSHVLCVCLDGAAVQAAKKELAGSALIVTDGSACPMAAQLMHDVYGCYKGGTARLALASFALLCELANSGSAAPVTSSLVADAAAAIRKNYAGLYGVEELSAQLGVSKSHLVRTFSAEMGISPGKYLTGVRIAEAQRLLSHREYSLEVIATLCGFSGANYLCKVFKKETGLTPAAYREKYRNSAPERQRSEAEDILFV